jgi:hypothetical protein
MRIDSLKMSLRDKASGACLLHVVMKFKEKSPSGLPPCCSTDSYGRIKSLGTTPIGDPMEWMYFGMGFLVRDDKTLLTNHHVCPTFVGQ